MTDEENDNDIEDEDDGEESGPDYYECFCCGYSCSPSTYRMGGQCPKCTAIMEEGYF